MGNWWGNFEIIDLAIDRGRLLRQFSRRVVHMTGKIMADTWITDITHFLDDEGEIISEPAQARKLGEYLAAIIVMSSYPEPKYPTEYRVNCRRRPNRKACQEEIVGFIDPETDDIVWMCPKCHDRGLISNWRRTIWDMSNADEAVH